MNPLSEDEWSVANLLLFNINSWSELVSLNVAGSIVVNWLLSNLKYWSEFVSLNVNESIFASSLLDDDNVDRSIVSSWLPY